MGCVAFLYNVVTSWKSIAVIQGLINGLVRIDGKRPNVALLFGNADKTTQDEKCQFHLNLFYQVKNNNELNFQGVQIEASYHDVVYGQGMTFYDSKTRFYRVSKCPNSQFLLVPLNSSFI
jgi:hypothetical protein